MMPAPRSPRHYYNDNDPDACDWLEGLMRGGLIPAGEIDRRSILDVAPDDLRGFTQCHFFAGIGGWPEALRLAGVSPDTPLWTGSPPCQPFSAAGARKGKDDARHLAPHFIRLVGACRPPLLFGEQVASADVFGKVAKGNGGPSAGGPQWAWLDDLSDRLEAAHYAVGALDIPAAFVGAPHIRQRTFFGAVHLGTSCQGIYDPSGARPVAARSGTEGEARNEAWLCGSERGRPDVRMADADSERHDGQHALLRQEQVGPSETSGGSQDVRLADAANEGFQIGRRGQGEQSERLRADERLADAKHTVRGGGRSA